MEILVKERKNDIRLALFDLDGTLLDTAKKILPSSKEALFMLKEHGILVGFSTSRGETMCLSYCDEIRPDIVIVSAGAVVKLHGEMIYQAAFSKEETRAMIALARKIGGEEIEITIDTENGHYWNYHEDPEIHYKGWGKTEYSDYSDFDQRSLKTCIQFSEDEQARRLAEAFPDCDYARFSDIDWYKFTPKTANKEAAMRRIMEVTGLHEENIMSFGDDFTDIGMLKHSGVGIAMGNAIPQVKAVADIVIGPNDEDSIAAFIKTMIEDETHAKRNNE